MSETYLMRALVCLAAPFACFAETPELEPDSLPGINLQEVTVKVRPIVSKSGGNSYIPSGEKKRVSTSGLDLLQKMQLPRVTVNPLTARVTVAGAADVRLLINGVEASSSELSALNPADIIRIEYYDNPGVRYAGADAVIDFITRRHDSGGEISAETMTALGNGKWASMDDLAGRYSHGLSTVTLNVGYAGLHRDNWMRDYEETWFYPDGPVSRREEGLPVTIGMSALESQINYSIARDRCYFLNVRGALTYNYVPGKEEGDRHTMLHTSGSDDVVEIMEHTREREFVPSLHLYGRRMFGGNSSITARITGTYSRSRTLHTYDESGESLPAVSIVSDVRGDKYTMSGETYYDSRSGASHYIAGVRHTQSFTSNRYDGSSVADVTFREAESSVYGEYDVSLGPWSLLANLTASRLYVSQSGIAYDKYTLLPSAGIGYEPSSAFRVRYDIKSREKQPPLAAMSDVEQPVQPGLVRRGNKDLHSYRIMDQRLAVSFYHELVSADLLLDYRNEHKPVMTSTFYDGNQFVMTYYNQRSMQELRYELSLALRPWADHLSVMLSPSMSRYFSHGNDYRHTRNIFHLGVSVDFIYGCWTLAGNIMTGAANNMYGEEIISEKDMNMLLVGYKKPQWSLQAGVFNAFMKDYWMKTENMSALTPYVSRAHCGRNTYAVIKLSVNLGFGRKSATPELPDDDDREIDTGILNGLK